MAFTIEQLRRDTPGCAELAHLNNAGASLPPAPVLEAQIGWLQREARVGGYRAAAEGAEQLAAFYTRAAELIGAQPDEIAWTSSATRAWQQAFLAVPVPAGARILTSRGSYASNYLSFLHRAERSGVVIEVVPSDEDGSIDLVALEEALSPGAIRQRGRVGLMCLTHVPTNSGRVQPAAAVGVLTRAAGVPFLLDACQSAGQIPLDVDALGCDLLSVTGRKYLRGPRGTGFLYLRRGLLPRLKPALIDLHSARLEGGRTVWADGARRFEQWERSNAGQAGLSAALGYALRCGVPALAARIQRLAARLRSGLRAIPGVSLCDGPGPGCGIVTFWHDHRPAAAIKAALRAHAVNVSLSDPDGTPLDAAERGLPPMVRASVHGFNTEQEIDLLLQVVERNLG